jgi:hypothetical protein
MSSSRRRILDTPGRESNVRAPRVMLPVILRCKVQRLSMSVNVCHQTIQMKVGNQQKIVSYYSQEAIAKLDKLSADKDRTKATLLREALDDLLEKYAMQDRTPSTKTKASKSRKKG